MKRKSTILLNAVLIIALCALPAAPIGKWSNNFQNQFGFYSTNAVATFAVDSAFVYGVSGSAWIAIFNSPVSQTNGAFTLYVYCSAVTGTPGSSSIDIYASSSGGDGQRPSGSILATSSNTSASGCGTASWLTYSIASISLTVGQYYFVILHNDTAVPGSNNFTLTTRGVSPSANVGTFNRLFATCSTTDGISTDPTCGSATIQPHGVMKFSDGTIIGYPFVVTAASTSNTAYRGNRYNFDEDMKVAGVTVIGVVATSSVVTMEVYNGASQLSTVTMDNYSRLNGMSAFFAAPVTFSGGTAIDVVWKPSANTTMGTYMTTGNSPPADVTTSAGTGISYVTGATPGSFTNTVAQFIPLALILDTNPAIASGGACVIGGM